MLPWLNQPKSNAQKPPLFSEEQIRAKAHEIWRSRSGDAGSPEADWQQAIADLQAESTDKKWQQFGNKDDREFALKVKQFHWERLKTVISALGLAATIFAGVGLLLTYLNAQKEQQLNTERLITDRFTKAVEQLGHDDIAVRIGGIYALERIAKDSPEDHWTVMEVLTAFVRERSPLQTSNSAKKPVKTVATDVQSALTAIGRRDATKDLEEQRLNLTKVNLVEADLIEANLQGTDFYRANLGKSFLYRANLQWAALKEANLGESFLRDANLQNASLHEANLRDADLINANLRGADLYGANSGGAKLHGANLEGAYLISANLGGAEFYGANLKKAYLYGANLRGAEGFGREQMAQAFFCRTTMPDGKVNNRDCKKLGIPEK